MANKLSKSDVKLIQFFEENGYAESDYSSLSFEKKVYKYKVVFSRKKNTSNQYYYYQNNGTEDKLVLYCNGKYLFSQSINLNLDRKINIQDIENSIVLTRRIYNRLKMKGISWHGLHQGSIKNTSVTIPYTFCRIVRKTDRYTELKSFYIEKEGLSKNPKTGKYFDHGYRFVTKIDALNISLISSRKKLRTLCPKNIPDIAS